MDKIYFSPGDVVRLRQADYIKSPNMLVVRKVAFLLQHQDDTSNMKGILCRWFTEDNLLQEAVFNFKDLIKIN